MTKISSIYAFYLAQGGLSLPDKEYYLSDSFSKQREAYLVHLKKMFTLLGESPEESGKHAATVCKLRLNCPERVACRQTSRSY